MRSLYSMYLVTLVLIIAVSANAFAADRTYNAHAADRAYIRIVSGSGRLIPQSSQIFVGEVKGVAWDKEGPDRTGKATFLVRDGIRGINQGDETLLGVREINPYVRRLGEEYFIRGLRFADGTIWLVFVDQDNAIRYIMQLETEDAPIIKEVAKAAEIDSQEPEDKLESLQSVLGEKPLKRSVLVNYGIEATGRLVRTHPEACSILLSVAGESDNPARIRVAAMDAIQRYLASGYIRGGDERPTWKEELKMILEAAPVMKDEPLELLYRYSSLLWSAVRRGSRESALVIPEGVKVESPEKVKAAINSVAAKLDESIPPLMEELAAAQSPDTTFPTEQQRNHQIGRLQRSIEHTRNRVEILKKLAESPALQPAPVPEDDEK